MIKVYLTLGVISTVVIAAAIYAFIQVGTPGFNRGLKLDSDRVSNLNSIESAIQTYYTKNKILPTNLDDLIKESSYSYLKIKDPETDTQYEYFITDQNSYKLCATFATSSDDKKPKREQYNYYDYDPYNEFKHSKGHHCFDLKATDYRAYPTPISKPRTTTILDDKVKEVTTDAKNINYSKFPSGFFTSEDEWGLINYAGVPVTVTITFKEPVKIKSIANLFTHCVLKCYNWTATARTKGDQVINIVGSKTADSGVESKEEIVSNEEIKEISITATRTDNSYVHWKKIKIEYK